MRYGNHPYERQLPVPYPGQSLGVFHQIGADAAGATFTGRPEGLARALEKLGSYSKRLPMQVSPNTAHMFIVNPLTAGNLVRLFSIHPPLEERIERLRGRPPESPRETDDDRGRKQAEDAWRNLMK